MKRGYSCDHTLGDFADLNILRTLAVTAGLCINVNLSPAGMMWLCTSHTIVRHIFAAGEYMYEIIEWSLVA